MHVHYTTLLLIWEMKKILIALLAIIFAALIGRLIYLYKNLDEQKQENREMQELAELDKKEMENEYQQFAAQYSEMKTQINNDSIIEQLSAEQEKTQRLLAELQRVKANDAREITRLKKELATVRAVLRSYVLEIDSLNRLNQNLVEENTRVKAQFQEATNKKVVQVDFALAKNVTASSGMKNVYVRITTPTGSVLGEGGTFNYENRTLEYSMKKSVEYGGQETPVSLFWNVNQAMSGGTYRVSIFADGHMIGSKSFSFK